ncbi:bifunctional diaminohydroxyphosphoribosylaminopyrimidine deaminase/5-amino-6-(5-phosphoribosylamino)uracil reductase RibD [Sulfurimonas sp. MAG313]|nr:bifunctional diaminohydroxyphosphoribosylaminopyrimidine deaminase/5-amino-6-(5-phosphoribosylamino)uracil reductase RibD [Sulfurimonas sp. MAG313]
MKMALDAAWQFQGLTYPNPAVGCTIVQNGAVLAVGAHAKAGKPHAEVMALKQAYLALSNDIKISPLIESHDIHDYLLKNHNNLFKTCDIYTTLEPCSHLGKTPSCASLLQAMSPRNIYISQIDENEEAKDGRKLLDQSGINVEVGMCKEEGANLLRPFLKWTKDNFIMYKWAQRLDGTIDGGLISDERSRIKVHAIRNVSDLLVIGGNTVREDRPTLDARLVDGKAPDVLIYSKHSSFDKEIPLFKIKDRNVFIEDNFEKLKSYKNILIEGGPSMFEATKDIVDRYLCFVAPKTGGKIKFSEVNLNFNILQSTKLDNDLMIWMDKKERSFNGN